MGVRKSVQARRWVSPKRAGRGERSVGRRYAGVSHPEGFWAVVGVSEKKRGVPKGTISPSGLLRPSRTHARRTVLALAVLSSSSSSRATARALPVLFHPPISHENATDGQPRTGPEREAEAGRGGSCRIFRDPVFAASAHSAPCPMEITTLHRTECAKARVRSTAVMGAAPASAPLALPRVRACSCWPGFDSSSFRRLVPAIAPGRVMSVHGTAF